MNKREKLELFFYQQIAGRVVLMLVAAFFGVAIPIIMALVILLAVFSPERASAMFHEVWARLGE